MTFFHSANYFGHGGVNASIPSSSITNVSQEFADIISNSQYTDYSSYKYLIGVNDPPIDFKVTNAAKYLPNEIETIAHLKLIRAFSVMKKRVIGSADSNNAANLWRVFVTRAVRRFIVFVTAIKKTVVIQGKAYDEPSMFNLANTKNSQLVATINQLLPPLDVIMVWHAFLLNSKSFYDTFVRCNLLDFANVPLPLHNIVACIDDFSFEFKVSQQFKRNYLDLIKKYTSYSLDLQYDINEINLYGDEKLFIYCPNCYEKLSEGISWINNENTGFSNSDLNATNINFALSSECYCTSFPIIAHEELRKLQLFADATKAGTLQGVYKHFSKVISAPGLVDRDPLNLSIEMALRIQEIWEDHKFEDLPTMVKSIISQLKNPLTGVLLMEYLNNQTISMTVPGGIEIGYDLVAAVMQQERFINRMNNINWLQSPFIKQISTDSCSRYANFFTMLSDPRLNQGILIPTLDIDLVWRTHRLHLSGYFFDCRSSACHSIIDDSLHEGRLDNSFKTTADAYQSRFGESYNVCYCQQCLISKSDAAEVPAANEHVVESNFEIKSLFDFDASSSFVGATSAKSGKNKVAKKRPRSKSSSSLSTSLSFDSNSYFTLDTIMNDPLTPIEEKLEDLISPVSCSGLSSPSLMPLSLYHSISSSDFSLFDAGTTVGEDSNCSLNDFDVGVDDQAITFGDIRNELLDSTLSTFFGTVPEGQFNFI